MAIFSSVPPPEQQPVVAVQHTLASLSIAPAAAKVRLTIPLDEAQTGSDAYKARKEPLRRDSLTRREALLKGKEGSRRRLRWENDHLLHVPNAQPPLPSDWEVHPTYPVHNNIPYYLAPLWDAGIRHRAEERVAAKKLKSKSASHGKSKAKSAAPVKDSEAKEEMVDFEGKGKVPQELRAKMKKARGAKTLLQELELEIRNFVRDWEIAHSPTKPSSRPMTPDQDSEDEEIVFIGRKALSSPGRVSALDTPDGVEITMSDEAKEVMEEELKREMKVYEGLKGSKEGGFARWLVHSLAEYYGLGSRSVDVGGRREAWVCVREVNGMSGVEGLRPLWGLV